MSLPKMANSDDVRSGRACDHCRSLKVRCFVDNESVSCQRCAKSGHTCIITAPQKRKQRKRTDTRIADLEKEVRAMQALLNHEESEVGSAPHQIQLRSLNIGYARSVLIKARSPLFYKLEEFILLRWIKSSHLEHLQVIRRIPLQVSEAS